MIGGYSEITQFHSNVPLHYFINSITPGVTNFPVSDLTWDQFIYPRGGKSDKTINAYVEALAIGAQFPPIKIQRVFTMQRDEEGGRP